MKNGLEVIIDGKLIDVVVDSLDIDYRIMDIATLGTIESDKTLPILAPFTQANNVAFGHLNDFAVENDKPRRKLPATIMQDGLPIIQNATARITKTSQGYEIEIGAGNFSLFDAIKDLKLGDLDWSDLDHFWNIATVYASRTNTSGYIYPAIDYFTDPATALIDNIDRTIRVDYLYPAVFVHTVLDKIGEYTGIKLAGDILDTSEFESLILPFVRRDYLRDRKGDKYLIEASTNFPETLVSGVFGGLIWAFDSTPGNYFFATSGNFSTQLQFADEVRVKGKIVLDIVNSSGLSRVLTISRTETRFFGAPGSFQQFLTDVNLPPGNTHYEYLFDSTIESNADVQALTFTFSSNGTNVTIASGATLSITEAEVLLPKTIQFGTPFGYSHTVNYVTLSSALPDMKCGDLLKALGNMFGLLYQYDEASNTVKVEQFKKLYDNRPFADDWTDKLNLPTLSVEYVLGNYGQINRMVLDNPDGLDPLQGGYTFTVDNEHLDPEIEVFKLPFQYTESVLRLEDLSIANIPIIEAEEDTSNPGQYIYKLNGDSKLRILILEVLDCSANNLVYYDGTNTRSSAIAPVGYFYKDGASFNLDLPNLIKDWNGERIAMLQKSRKGTIEVLLSAVDIAKLDFFKPVYSSLWSKYFAKNNVNRRGNGLSTVVLVEM